MPELCADDLSVNFKQQDFTFNDTDNISPYHGVLGQQRAIAAIQFGIAMLQNGYNLFVAGEAGTGRSSYVKNYLHSEAKRQSTAISWCYLNNFTKNREPKALGLESTQLEAFKQAIEKLIEQLLSTFPAVFEHPAHQQKKAAIDHSFNRKYDTALKQIEREALKKEVAIFRDANSISFTPMYEGKALDEADFAQLDDDARERFHENVGELEQRLSEELSELPQWKRESAERLRKLNQNTINHAIEPLLEPIYSAFKEIDGIQNYLQALQQYLPRFILEELADERLLELRDEYSKRTALENSLLPNMLIYHEPNSGAPVVYEPHPSYANLFGRIEFVNEQGALTTSFQQICAGALHRANGGYLILDAQKVLSEPFVWEALKRALENQQLNIESPINDSGIINTASLTPASIALKVKVILIGSHENYYLLQHYDAEFKQLFRSLVDFDSDYALNEDNLEAYSKLLKSRINQQQYAELTAQAVRRMVLFSARLSGKQTQLSTRLGEQFDLLAEADFIRQLAKEKRIDEHHIERALSAKQERTGQAYDKLFTQMLDGTILLESTGSAVGKVNGLTVMSLADTSFGSPARITATVYPGKQGVLDIEREAELGQSIHSKGVLILAGYLGQRYAQGFHMSLSAQLAMEQSYGYIDGDSASLAELCCLISALIQQPIRQSLAITGSINQYGEVQAIGGVNEKIEGFFRLCQARGLNGEQGVIIPDANRCNLVLNQDIIQAVKENNFHVYSIKHVDDALALLMQQPVGTANNKGIFPMHSINQRIVSKLQQLANITHNHS